MGKKVNRRVSAFDLKLRCYAEQDGDQWVAVCIDLNLAAQSDTLEDARVRLHRQIESYVYDAVAGPDREHGAELLFNRKAELPMLLRYHFISAAIHLHALTTKFRTFVDVLPLAPSKPNYA